jgi:hypothetical protein
MGGPILTLRATAGESLLRSVAGRERRALWATLSFVFVVGIGATMYLSNADRNQAIARAAKDTRNHAQLLSAVLSNKQLSKPVGGPRYERLAERVREAVTLGGPVVSVTIWSSEGRILFDADRSVVGSTPPEMQPVISAMTSSSGGVRVQDDRLETFVPISRSPNGPVAMAQLAQPLTPVLDQVGGLWAQVRTFLAFALVLWLALLALTFVPIEKVPAVRLPWRRSPEEAGDEAKPAVTPSEGAPARAERQRRGKGVNEGPAYMLPGFRQIDEARQAAEELALRTEGNFQALQSQFDRAVDQVKTLESQVNAQQALRQQLKEAEARAQAAEVRVKELEAELDKVTFVTRSGQ